MVFFEKLNKVAKNIESKTGDAIEIAKYTAQIASEENAHKEDLKKIGKYYYDLAVKDVSTSVDDGIRRFFSEILQGKDGYMNV